MVNGITTPMGGTHVSYVLEKISNTVRELLEKKHKNIKIKPLDIKSRIKLYLNLKMFNPEFSNQSKEALKSYHDKFPSKPEISNKMINKIMNSEIVESILNYIKAKELMELAKINKQTKSTKVKIEKLNDAYYAGTEKSIECSLYLSEGDSARNNISAGIQALKDGKDYNGTYALRGKMLNVREADNTKIIKSDEISNIVTALGLVVGKKYKSLDELRYGKLVIATDADIDGHHIKGLLINIIHFY
jgi:DNA topoisomerase-2